MKRTTIIITSLVTFKFLIQILGNRNYGFHRDELLHLSVAEHLDWGFMEFPPFIAVLGKLSGWLFDYSLVGTRLFSSLAGCLILVLCFQMAKSLSGKTFAILLAGISCLSFWPFYRNHTLFQPVAFDQLFWTLGFYYLIRFVNTKQGKYLLFTGLVLGLGLQTKYTILVWALAVFVGLIFYEKGRLFKNRWLYLAGLLALLLFLPNLLWQYENNFPLIRHLQALGAQEGSSPDFGIAQLGYPLTLVVGLLGVYFLNKQGKYRFLGIASIIIFSTMWMLGAKPYYLFSLYPLLFAAGAVQIEALLLGKHMAWRILIGALLLGLALPQIPDMTPVLPIETYTKYAGLEEEAGRVELTGDYADMFGWEEQVKLVDSIYQSLSPAERSQCVIWAENYGEAGALQILGKAYGLPQPISRHGSFWLWGYDNPDATVWISLGNEQPAVEYAFEETELVKVIYHKYAIGEENGIPVYICRRPQVDIPQWWADFEPYVFD